MSKNFELLQQLHIDVDTGVLPPFMPADSSYRGGAEEMRKPVFEDRDKRAAIGQALLHVPNNRPAQEEALKLVHSVFLSQGSSPRRVVVFAAIDSGNGCSQICALSAKALSASVRTSVCLVDANFRNSDKPSSYSVSSPIGLVDALCKPGPIHEFTMCAGPSNLALLPRGTITRESAGFLNSRSMKTRIEDLRSEYAYVLIDAPPLNSYSDAATLGQLTDGIVLILEANSTRRGSALKIVEHLHTGEVTVLGAVLNKRTFPIPEAIYRIL